MWELESERWVKSKKMSLGIRSNDECKLWIDSKWMIIKHLGDKIHRTDIGAGYFYIPLLHEINIYPLALRLEKHQLETPFCSSQCSPRTASRVLMYNICSVNVPGSNNCLNF